MKSKNAIRLAVIGIFSTVFAIFLWRFDRISGQDNLPRQDFQRKSHDVTANRAGELEDPFASKDDPVGGPPKISKGESDGLDKAFYLSLPIKDPRRVAFETGDTISSYEKEFFTNPKYEVLFRRLDLDGATQQALVSTMIAKTLVVNQAMDNKISSKNIHAMVKEYNGHRYTVSVFTGDIEKTDQALLAAGLPAENTIMALLGDDKYKIYHGCPVMELRGFCKLLP